MSCLRIQDLKSLGKPFWEYHFYVSVDYKVHKVYSEVCENHQYMYSGKI